MFLRKIISLPFLLFLFFVSLYLHNLSRSVYAGDVGDFTTAASVMGVAHPPGYPLFTFLGFLLTKINFNQTPAFMIGLISVFSSAFGIVLFYLIVKLLTKNKLISFLSSIILGFTYFFWFYSEIAEVFAFNNFFVLLLFYLALRIYHNVYNPERSASWAGVKGFYIFSFFLGLSFTNHQTIIFIVPSLFLLIFNKIKLIFFPLNKNKLLKIFYCFLFFILPLSFYAYIPFASSKNPVINWDHVKDIPTFLNLILRKDYGTFNAGIFIPPTFLQRIIIVKTYLFSLLTQLTIPVVFVCLFGAISLFKNKKIIFYSFLLAFFISGPLFIGYAGFPLYGSFFIGIYERFFVLSSIILLLCFPSGLIFLSEIFSKLFKRNSYALFFQIIFFIIPIFLFIYNFPKTNLSNVFIGDYLGYDILSPLPKNSLIFLSGDTALFNTWYVRYALKFRTDIKIINLNNLGGDDYFSTVLEKVKKENPTKSTVDNAVIAIKQLNIIYPIFSVEQLNLSKNTNFVWVPYGLGFRLLKENEKKPTAKEFYLQSDAVWSKLHVPILSAKTKALGSLSIADIPNVYANAAVLHANYILSEYKDAEKGLYWINKSFQIDPLFPKAHQVLGVYYLTIDKKCNLAADNLNTSLENDRFQKITYFLLYATYKDCLQDKVKANNVAILFSKVFQKNFFDEINDTLKGGKK